MSDNKQNRQNYNNCDDCECRSFDYPECDDAKGLNAPTRTIASMISCLSEEYDAGDCKPQDVIKQLADDIKEATSEYESIESVIASYLQFFDKLDCMLTDADKWKREIESWLNNAQVQKVKIDSQRESYLRKEHKKCCNWIDNRMRLNRRKDCLTQSGIKVDEAKDDFNAYKEFEKLLKSQFDTLKAIHLKASENRVKKNFTTIYVLYLEYKQIHSDLGLVMTWTYKEQKCKTQANCDPTPNAQSDKVIRKDDWSPEILRKHLTENLKKLILARYQRYRWNQENTELVSQVQKHKDSCEKIRRSRVDDLIKEAFELQTTNPSDQVQASLSQ